MQKSWKILSVGVLGLSICCSALSALAQPEMMKDTRPAAPLAQATVADKARVMEYFEGQRFEEAIGYLASSLGPDSANISVLGYLGYAYYMNDDRVSSVQCYDRIFRLDMISSRFITMSRGLWRSCGGIGRVMSCSRFV